MNIECDVIIKSREENENEKKTFHLKLVCYFFSYYMLI